MPLLSEKTSRTYAGSEPAAMSGWSIATDKEPQFPGAILTMLGKAWILAVTSGGGGDGLGGSGDGGGGRRGEGGGGGDDMRVPQSLQSAPKAHVENSAPEPPSSQMPSSWLVQVLVHSPPGGIDGVGLGGVVGLGGGGLGDGGVGEGGGCGLGGGGLGVGGGGDGLGGGGLGFGGDGEGGEEGGWWYTMAWM
jgi:hypothetical protein